MGGVQIKIKRSRVCRGPVHIDEFSGVQVKALYLHNEASDQPKT